MLNSKESEIVHGFTFELFGWLIGCYLSFFILRFITSVISKAYRLKIRDTVFYDTLTNVLNSKMVDIQKVSSGKVFDTTSELQSLQSNYMPMILEMIPAIIPFMTLIVRELMHDYRMGLITIICQLLSFIMACQSDRLFAWSTKSKQAKSELTGVTVDAFMNVKTLKYLGQSKFARNRLLKYQNKYHPYAVNLLHIGWFRLIDMVMYIPLFANIFLSKDDIELLAFIVMSQYTIKQVTSILVEISENSQEMKACNKLLSSLKGDDVDIPEPLNNNTLILDDIVFDYGDDSVAFKIDHLEFKPNTRTIVYGESGEGKSSLANLISGGIKPKFGTVPYYKSYYIWQETEMLDDTLWNNIVFDNPEEITKNEVILLFKQLNMFDWFLELSDGFDTLVGERGW